MRAYRIVAAVGLVVALIAIGSILWPKSDLTGRDTFERSAQHLMVSEAEATGYMTRQEYLYCDSVRRGIIPHNATMDKTLLSGDVQDRKESPKMPSKAMRRGLRAQELMAIGLTSDRIVKWERDAMTEAEAYPTQ